MSDEKGNANPGPEFFVRFASIYKVNLNYLYMGAQDMFINDQGKLIKEVNVDDEIDTIEKLIWLIENSLHVRSLIINSINRIIYEDRDIINRDTERTKAKEKKLSVK